MALSDIFFRHIFEKPTAKLGARGRVTGAKVCGGGDGGGGGGLAACQKGAVDGSGGGGGGSRCSKESMDDETEATPDGQILSSPEFAEEDEWVLFIPSRPASKPPAVSVVVISPFSSFHCWRSNFNR